MKVVIYLCFTILSILIQFCIMDMLERNKSDVSSQEINNFKDFLERPHALYYKIDGNASMLNKTPKYSNVSLPIDPFLDKYYGSSTPTYDMVFEDNTTVADVTDTTEMYSTTEYANLTDFELFPKISTTPKPNLKPKKLEHRDECFCDLSYHSCDINCCCDEECSVSEQQLFSTCQEEKLSSQQHNMCNNNISIFSINGLVCHSKHNLPQKRNAVSYLMENINVDSVKLKIFTWIEQVHSDDKQIYFYGKQYIQNEPIWILHENKITSMDLPTPYVNNICTDRKPMKFLRNENYQCLVRFKSLESLKIYRFISSTQVVSVPVENWDTKTLNCTNLLCTKWNIVVCDQESCQKYNETIHEPQCNDKSCKNIALKVEYVFQCNVSNITHATVRLYTQDIELNNLYFNQKIKVTFNLGAENVTENIVHFSGNPGYVEELPVIASFDKGNHTDNILNNNKTNFNILRYPDNVKGTCLLSNTTYKVVQFGENIRSKCNYEYDNKNIKNATVICRTMQSEINNILDANTNIFVSPLGNPWKLVDKDWIEMKREIASVGLVFGEYDSDNNTVICNNLATKLSYVFTYANVGNDEKTINKILDAKCYLKSENKVRLSSETISAVLTIDVSFLDVTKQPEYEYAGAPHLNIHLPEDFFYPFTQNKGNKEDNYIFILVLICGLIMRNKIHIS